MDLHGPPGVWCDNNLRVGVNYEGAGTGVCSANLQEEYYSIGEGNVNFFLKYFDKVEAWWKCRSPRAFNARKKERGAW